MIKYDSEMYFYLSPESVTKNLYGRKRSIQQDKRDLRFEKKKKFPSSALKLRQVEKKKIMLQTFPTLIDDGDQE